MVTPEYFDAKYYETSVPVLESAETSVPTSNLSKIYPDQNFITVTAINVTRLIQNKLGLNSSDANYIVGDMSLELIPELINAKIMHCFSVHKYKDGEKPETNDMLLLCHHAIGKKIGDEYIFKEPESM